MKSLVCALALGLFCTFSGLAQDAAQKSIAVTVYNNNLGVIKDVRSINIPSGSSQIKIVDVAQLIDPTSVHIALNGSILEQNYQYDLVSVDKILERYIDREVQLIGENNEVIQGVLLSSNAGQIVLRKSDGGLIMLPNLQKYRASVGSLPEGLRTKPTLVWTVNSKSSGNQDVELSYQTGGMNWHAEYVAVLNENDTKLDLNSWVSIENMSGAKYPNATLKLVAGDVNRVQPATPRNVYMMDGAVAKQAEAQFEEKEFFEYHIYNLQRPATIENNETKQISLFDAAGVSVTKKYMYRGGRQYSPYGGGGNSNGKVAVVVEFENREANKLGMPMPAGKVRVYKSDGHSIEFVGEDMIDHTPRDEKISLRIGDAFDIVAEEVQTDNKRISDKVHEETWQITLRNHKKEDVVVDVERALGLNWEMIRNSHEFEKKNAQNIIFKVPVAKGKDVKLEYTVRYSY